MSVEMPSSEFVVPIKRMPGLETLRIAAWIVVTVAGSWWFLGQLASVMRPLLLAVFLAYVLMPFHNRLRRNLPDAFALISLAGLSALVLLGLAFLLYTSLLGLKDDLPQLRASATKLQADSLAFAKQYLPERFTASLEQNSELGSVVEPWITTVTVQAVNIAAGGLVEAATAGLFLAFLLLESAKFPERVRAAYPSARADNILRIAERINGAIIQYMRAKVWASLALALPVGILLTVFGVKYAFLWALVTFLCNFIPYIGTVIAYSLPTAFAVLQFGFGTNAAIVAGGLLAIHTLTSTLVEPMMLGKAIGISPLVILAALAIWGLLWGLPGMFLAVPLTVVLKIVFENIDVTRPVARLLSD
jgi:AI-2 transport protein TqsA